MRFRAILVVGFLSLALSGCSHRDWFAPLDRCYLADWTNHHSYLSCCRDGNSGGTCCHCNCSHEQGHVVDRRAYEPMPPR